MARMADWFQWFGDILECVPRRLRQQLAVGFALLAVFGLYKTAKWLVN